MSALAIGNRATLTVLSPYAEISQIRFQGVAAHRVPRLSRDTGCLRPGPLREPHFFNSAGGGMVTAPVAAHSVPRVSVASNAADFMAAGSWPSTVTNTRPLP